MSGITPPSQSGNEMIGISNFSMNQEAYEEFLAMRQEAEGLTDEQNTERIARNVHELYCELPQRRLEEKRRQKESEKAHEECHAIPTDRAQAENNELKEEIEEGSRQETRVEEEARRYREGETPTGETLLSQATTLRADMQESNRCVRQDRAAPHQGAAEADRAISRVNRNITHAREIVDTASGSKSSCCVSDESLIAILMVVGAIAGKVLKVY